MFLANSLFMKIAIPEWQGRVSPVLDAASLILLVEIESGRELRRTENTLNAASPWSRAQALKDLHAELVICGAVSQELEMALRAAGIELVGNICGPVEAVLNAYRLGKLDETTFAMPGCCGRRRRFRHGGGRRGGRWRN